MNFVKGVFRFLWHLVDGVRKLLHLVLLLFIVVRGVAVDPDCPEQLGIARRSGRRAGRAVEW